MWLERKKEQENPEQQQKQNQETTDTLKNFWNWWDKDKKAIEDPQFWKKAVWVIESSINEKKSNINDENSKKQIDWLSQEIKQFSNLWKLDKDQIKELQSIYNKIEAIEWTEHAEDAKAGDEAREKMNQQKKSNAEALLKATESLRDFMKWNFEQQQEKQKEQAEKWRNAREEWKEAQQVASLEADALLSEWWPNETTA